MQSVSRSRRRTSRRRGWVGLLPALTAGVVVLTAFSPSGRRPEPDRPAAPATAPSVPAVAGGRGGSATVQPRPGGWPRTAVPPSDPRRDWVWPVSPAPLLHPFDPPEEPWSPGHRGVDLAASAGQTVVSPHAGTVIFAGVVAGRGVVVVAHQAGLRSTFEPVESPAPLGSVVGRGAILATVAGTPGHCSPATCLHWGVLRSSTYLDPLAFVGALRVVLLPYWAR